MICHEEKMGKAFGQVKINKNLYGATVFSSSFAVLIYSIASGIRVSKQRIDPLCLVSGCGTVLVYPMDRSNEISHQNWCRFVVASF